MATQSNRSRIDEALTLISEAFEPIVAKTLAPHVPSGANWTALFRVIDEAKGKIGFDYDVTDVALQLKAVNMRFGDLGFLFDDVLSRADKNFASELSIVRNELSHKNRAFGSDETLRALDTAERFLRSISAIESADVIRRSKHDLQRQTYADEVKREVRSHAAMPGLESQNAKPWRDVLQPHADIAANDFARAEFAADLFQVANEVEADAGYNDPVQFFARTYLTDGLKQLLGIAARRIAGDLNADPVINLQTTFGGGKTHSMLAVWHMTGGTELSAFPQSLQDALADQGANTSAIGSNVRRVAIVGNEVSPGQPWVKPDGTVISTLWGELAWQLGGAAAYAQVAEADKTGTIPPGSILRQVIADYSPCVILIDEWVAYARGLYGDQKLVGGTFDTQFTFAQQLTEAVKSVPGALLLVSIPASDVKVDGEGVSDLEVGGSHGREALLKLQNVVSRVARRWTPATSVESFEIVKRRLFKEPDAEARRQIDVTVGAFVSLYNANLGELPAETKDLSYGQRIREAYPIHPELFDRLYGDWSTLDKFQRTRGVLRLMSAVVHELYYAGDNSPLIMPGSIPLDAPAVRDEITGYLEDAWKTIIEKDIDGENASAVLIDREKPLFGGRALTRRIARATFMGSAATLNSAHKGIERKSVFLGVAMPGDTIGNFGSSLTLLGERAGYLYGDLNRYWFDRQPSLNRKASERAESFRDDDVFEYIVSQLKLEPKSTPQFKDVIFAPDDSSDVPEAEFVRLILAHPRYTHDGKGKDSSARAFALDATTRRGPSARTNANTVVVVAADEQRLRELESSVRNLLAWRSIQASKDDLDLTLSQVEEVKRRIETFGTQVAQRIRETWIWALYAEQVTGQPLSIRAQKVDGASGSVVTHASEKLGRHDVILEQSSPQALHVALNSHLRAKWNEGRISVGELWGYHLRYPYLPRLREKRVLTEAIAEVFNDPAWQEVGFALSEGYDEASGDFTDLRIPLIDRAPAILDSQFLVKSELAVAQCEREDAMRAQLSAENESPQAGLAPAIGAPSGQAQGAPAAAVMKTPNAEFHATIELRGDVAVVTQISKIAEELLAHLQGADPDMLEVQITVDAAKLEGFGGATVRTVSENANTLGVSSWRFADAPQ